MAEWEGKCYIEWIDYFRDRRNSLRNSNAISNARNQYDDAFNAAFREMDSIFDSRSPIYDRRVLYNDVSADADEWLIDRELFYSLSARDRPVGIKYCLASDVLVGLQTIYGEYDSLAEGYLNGLTYGLEHGNFDVSPCEERFFAPQNVRSIDFSLNASGQYAVTMNLDNESFTMGSVSDAINGGTLDFPYSNGFYFFGFKS